MGVIVVVLWIGTAIYLRIKEGYQGAEDFALTYLSGRKIAGFMNTASDCSSEGKGS